MAEFVDYYKLLGVSIFATDQEIKTSYFEKIKQYHPDTFTGNKAEAEKITSDLNVAYTTLKDTEKRLAYDIKYGFDKMRQNFNKNNSSKIKTEQNNKYKKSKNKKTKQKQQKYNNQKVQNETESYNKKYTNNVSPNINKQGNDVNETISKEQIKFKKEKYALDTIIIFLLVIVILLIVFHK